MASGRARSARSFRGGAVRSAQADRAQLGQRLRAYQAARRAAGRLWRLGRGAACGPLSGPLRRPRAGGRAPAGRPPPLRGRAGLPIRRTTARRCGDRHPEHCAGMRLNLFGWEMELLGGHSRTLAQAGELSFELRIAVEHPKQPPRLSDALQVVLPGVLERQTRSCCQILDRRRHQKLARGS